MRRNKVENEAIMLRVRSELAKRIDELAAKYSDSSRNQLASEVIDMYLDFWEVIQDAKHKAHHQQILVMQENMNIPKDKKQR